MEGIKGKITVKKMAINYIGGGKRFTQSCYFVVLFIIAKQHLPPFTKMNGFDCSFFIELATPVKSATLSFH
jgi:hypothetical protein